MRRTTEIILSKLSEKNGIFFSSSQSRKARVLESCDWPPSVRGNCLSIRRLAAFDAEIEEPRHCRPLDPAFSGL